LYLLESNNLITHNNPIDKNLHTEIAAMDATFFNAYNTCDLEKQKEIYNNTIEFFHDKNGLETSKKKHFI